MDIEKTIVNAALKSMFKTMLGFSEIIEGTIEADSIKDTIKLKGFGVLKGEQIPKRVFANNILKLSEKADHIETFMAEVRTHIDAVRIDHATITFKYKEKITENIIKYINSKGEKCKTPIITPL